MGLINDLMGGLRKRVLSWLEGGTDPSVSDRASNMLQRRDYRLGMQKRFLRRSREGFDDNVVGNFLGLALDRSISLLFGKEVKFEYATSAAQEFIDTIWEENNKSILLHKLAMYGGEDGTVFVKLVPDSTKVSGWRIVAQDPVFKHIITDPDDDEHVISYITQYKTVDLNNHEVGKRETVTINTEDPIQPVISWLIINEINNRETGGKWVEVSREVWPYPDPPIIHWQNLPMVGNVWGMPDLPDDVIELQDKSNFANSNINRIIRLFAHPFRWSRMFGGRKLGAAKDSAELDIGPDKMPNQDNPAAEIFQLPPVGDVPGAVSHAQNLRQMIFDVTRNMDISSMKDKVGALTNFGLRILFYDALNKLETKRGLYGWGLREINRRLFIFSNQEPVDCKVIWEDPLPIDETVLRQNLQIDLSMGVVDKQTVAERLGYDWETVKLRLAEQQQQSDNIGAALLRAFDRTGGINPDEFGNQQRGKQPLQLAR